MFDKLYRSLTKAARDRVGNWELIKATWGYCYYNRDQNMTGRNFVYLDRQRDSKVPSDLSVGSRPEDVDHILKSSDDFVFAFSPITYSEDASNNQRLREMALSFVTLMTFGE